MQIRRLVGALRPVVPNASMSGGAPVTARDTPVLDACQQLTGLLAEQQERRSTFMAENGVAALIELLDERNAKVGAEEFNLDHHESTDRRINCMSLFRPHSIMLDQLQDCAGAGTASCWTSCSCAGAGSTDMICMHVVIGTLHERFSL